MLYTIFQCEFICNSDYVIQRLYFEKIWYGHHQASFFSVNSSIMIIISSGDYIDKKVFESMLNKDPRQGSKIKNNVKSEIQDEEAQLRLVLLHF